MDGIGKSLKRTFSGMEGSHDEDSLFLPEEPKASGSPMFDESPLKETRRPSFEQILGIGCAEHEELSFINFVDNDTSSSIKYITPEQLLGKRYRPDSEKSACEQLLELNKVEGLDLFRVGKSILKELDKKDLIVNEIFTRSVGKCALHHNKNLSWLKLSVRNFALSLLEIDQTLMHSPSSLYYKACYPGSKKITDINLHDAHFKSILNIWTRKEDNVLYIKEDSDL